MLKIRFKRAGRKRQPSYRIVLVKSDSRRDGRPLENLGYYNPLTKQFVINIARVMILFRQGAQVSATVKNFLSSLSPRNMLFVASNQSVGGSIS
jgi:small subunit ribosomal protein S16